MHKCLFLILIINFSLFGQSIEPMATDRPDQTECANIVPKGFFQMENGFLIENDKHNDVKTKELIYLTSLLKYGISKRLELRVIIENSKFEQTSTFERVIYKGINPIQIGFKANLLHTKGIIPETSLIAHLGFPKVASESKMQQKWSPNFRFTMQHQLTEKASLAYNIGAEKDGESENTTAIYTLTTGRSLGKKVGAYIEFYGFFSKNFPAQHSFDGGFTFPLKENFMLDVSVSLGLSASAPDHYISFGLSFRLPK